MAITMSSSTSIELLLKERLQKEKISFKEQHRIYEKGDDLLPKYVVDFVVTYNDVSVVVECDGVSYHSSDRDVEWDLHRESWLKHHGYKNVLRFTSYQLRYQMDVVILNIKYALGIIKIPKSKLRFKEKTRKDILTVNVERENLHKVKIFYYYMQLADEVWIVYKLYDETLNKASEERIKMFYNVPDMWAAELAIYVALKDLRKSVELTVFCSSEWLTEYFNRKNRKERLDRKILGGIGKILENQNYVFRYINTRRDATYYDHPSQDRLIIQELRSRCRQVCYGAQRGEHMEKYEKVDFSTYIK